MRSSTRKSKRATRSRPAPIPTRSSSGGLRASSASRAAQTPDATWSRSMKTERPRCARQSPDACDAMRDPAECEDSGYFPAAFSAAQRLQSGRLPVPRARFRSSMLLPSMQRGLSWCLVAGGLVEYQGRGFGMLPLGCWSSRAPRRAAARGCCAPVGRDVVGSATGLPLRGSPGKYRWQTRSARLGGDPRC